MRPTFMGFEAAKSSIFSNQKSLDIVGNNLANTNTPGYTRQRVARATVVTSTTSRLAGNRVGLAGQGVETQGVSQTRDAFLDQRFREEYSKASYHGQTSGILNTVQSALGDGADITDESGLYGALTQIYENLNSYIQEPTMETQANLVMSSFKNIAQVLQQMDDSLTNAANQFTEDLHIDVARVNDIASQVAHLNKMISEDSTIMSNGDSSYFGPNELLDQRNLLLDELAGYGDLTIKEMPNGSINVDMGGHSLVDHDESDALDVRQNDDNTVTMKWRSDGESIEMSNGTLLASVHYLNGKGHNVETSNDEPHQGIPYYRDQLDTFASALAQVANNTIPVLGDDGEPAKDADGKIIYKTLLGGKEQNGETNPANVTADNISISTEWSTEGAGYFIYNKEENIEDYAQQLAAQLTDTSFTFKSHGESFEGTFAEFEVSMLGKLGTDIHFHQGRQESYAQVADTFLDQRDSISGVNSDEETADMLMYQKSYEAAARVMTVLDELLDVVINRMGSI